MRLATKTLLPRRFFTLILGAPFSPVIDIALNAEKAFEPD
jgi:hypothetical protein